MRSRVRGAKGIAPPFFVSSKRNYIIREYREALFPGKVNFSFQLWFFGTISLAFSN